MTSPVDDSGERHPAGWRVLTWNVHGSALPPLELLADVIARSTPDVVSLQEVRRSQAQHLAQTLRWEHAWMFKHNALLPLWWLAEGLAIVSPHRIDRVERAEVSRGASWFSHRRRVVIAATIHRGHDELRVYGTHLATHSADERITQAALIAHRMSADVAEHGPTAAVVAGDLNARDEVEVIREFSPLALVDPGGDPTSPAVAPVQRIDYVLVPAAAQVLDRRTPTGGQHWHRLSDHLPTLVEFEL